MYIVAEELDNSEAGLEKERVHMCFEALLEINDSTDIDPCLIEACC